MAVEIWGDGDRRLTSGKGKLVYTRHFPSIPLDFWNGPDGTRLHDTYFTSFSDVWARDGYAKETAHGGLIIHDRSNAVLNPGGMRIGTAEIYRQVEKVEEVLRSIAIGQDWQDDVHVLLFIRLRDGVRLNEPLRERIRQTIRANTTPRHVPARIIQAANIPHTLSGKIVELAVCNVIRSRPVESTDALANPQALELYCDLAKLRDWNHGEPGLECAFHATARGSPTPTAMARHVLVETEAEAVQLRQRLARGRGFATLAKEHSTCPSDKHGGDLDEVRPGQMVRSIDNTIFRKPVGVLQDSLKSQFGYHLLEVYFRD